uniref:Lipoprotein n=1 Tax=Candidatus Caldatribacterium californiense TaxID=1454726 RepID=A0A7V3YKR6_9BACT
MRNKLWVLVAATVLAATLGVSCVSLEGVTELTYHMEVRQGQHTQQGTFAVFFTPLGKDWKISVHYKLGNEEFSTTFTTQGKTREEALFSTLLMHPFLGVLLGPITAAQGMYLFVTGVLQGQPEVGFFWRTRDVEGREVEISTPSSEQRFGREAIWIVVKVAGETAARFLVEKQSLIPLVIDLAENQQRFFCEAQKVKWQENDAEEEKDDHEAGLPLWTKATCQAL